jgi:RHS repeat-associated protein
MPTNYQFTGQYNESDFGLYFYNACWYDSSLGRFAQADTIIPPTQGVQAWNRYAYTNNNPLRYIDPTGHKICDNIDSAGNCVNPPDSGGGSSGSSSSQNGNSSGATRSGEIDHDRDNDGILDIPDSDIGPVWLSNDFTQLCDKSQTLTECFYLRYPVDLLEDPNIDSDELYLLMLAIYFDVKTRDTTGPQYLGRLNYDSPFWNGYGILPGEVCINGSCYPRAEVNYIAQGMWGADAGESIQFSRLIVWTYKELVWYEEPSPGTYAWHDFGYNFYTALDPYYEEFKELFR